MTAAVTPKGVRRQYALVSAAAELLCEGGFDAVRHRAVARRAGLPLAATTYYFSSLDDLIVKAVEHVGALEAQQLRERVAALSRRRRGAESTVDVLVDLLVGDDPENAGQRAVDLALRALHRVRASAGAARCAAANSAAAHRRGRRGRRAVRPLGSRGTACPRWCVPSTARWWRRSSVTATVPAAPARATLIDVIDVLAPITAPISAPCSPQLWLAGRVRASLTIAGAAC